MPARRSASLTSSGMPARTPTTSAAAISPSAPPIGREMRPAIRCASARPWPEARSTRPLRRRAARARVRAGRSRLRQCRRNSSRRKSRSCPAGPGRTAAAAAPGPIGSSPPLCRRRAARRDADPLRRIAQVAAAPCRVTSMVSRTRPVDMCSIADDPAGELRRDFGAEHLCACAPCLDLAAQSAPSTTNSNAARPG